MEYIKDRTEYRTDRVKVRIYFVCGGSEVFYVRPEVAPALVRRVKDRQDLHFQCVYYPDKPEEVFIKTHSVCRIRIEGEVK